MERKTTRQGEKKRRRKLYARMKWKMSKGGDNREDEGKQLARSQEEQGEAN